MDPGTHTLQQLLEDQQAEEELLQLSAGTTVCMSQLMQSYHAISDCYGLPLTCRHGSSLLTAA